MPNERQINPIQTSHLYHFYEIEYRARVVDEMKKLLSALSLGWKLKRLFYVLSHRAKI